MKPSNVLLAEDGRVVLTDFGVAQVAGSTTLTENGSFVGSPEYTAPERMSGAGTGPESDLWSLGVLLCAVLSGASPFHRDSLGGVLHAVVTEEIRPPAQAGPLLPVVRGLLERDPRRRLDAVSAQRMLRAFLSTGRTPATPAAAAAAGGPPRARWSAKRTVLTAALLVVAAAGAGVSAAALLADRGGDGGGAPATTVPVTPTAEPTPAPTGTPTTGPVSPSAPGSGT